VFEHCTQLLHEQQLVRSRDLYWQAVCHHSGEAEFDVAVDLLQQAAQANPFVAEPLVLQAQVRCCRGGGAVADGVGGGRLPALGGGRGCAAGVWRAAVGDTPLQRRGSGAAACLLGLLRRSSPSPPACAQVCLHRGQWAQADELAGRALALLCTWGACWDKRMAWEAWVEWARVLLQGARARKFATTSFGMLNLGLVDGL
jgi:hypothetical protein